MNKNKTFLTIIVNILFLAFFISICLFLYNVNGKKNVSEMMKSTENVVAKGKPELKDINKTPVKPELPPFKNYHFKYTYKIPVKGKIGKLTFILPVPYDENEKQYITNKQFSPQPTRIYNEDDNTFAEFEFSPIINETAVISIEGTAKVRTHDFQNAMIENKNNSPEKDITRYLKPEKYIESDDSLIKSTAAKIKGADEKETVKNIYLFVNKNMEYKVIPGISGAKRALIDKQGKCSEFAALMVALCRAKGIPARVVTGNMARKGISKHSWVEVYYKDYGWVAYDPDKRPTPYRKYVNGKLVENEIRYEYDKSNIDFIASVKNNLSPWFVKMSTGEDSPGSATIIEDFDITPEE